MVLFVVARRFSLWVVAACLCLLLVVAFVVVACLTVAVAIVVGAGVGVGGVCFAVVLRCCFSLGAWFFGFSRVGCFVVAWLLDCWLLGCEVGL